MSSFSRVGQALYLIPALIVGAASGSFAATLCVNPGGTGGCYATVDSAVAASARGDVVQIAAGSYPSCVVVPAKHHVTLQGAGRDQTILVGACSGYRVVISTLDGSKVAISGLTIADDAQAGDGLRCVHGTVVAHDLRVTACRRGLDLEFSCRAQITSTEIDGNLLGILAGIPDFTPRLDLDASSVHDNGIGIQHYGGRTKITRSTIHGNGPGEYPYDGNGIRTLERGLIVEASTISGNAPAGIDGPHNVQPVEFLMRSTILADNAQDCSSAVRIRSQGNNLIESPGCVVVTRPTDLTGVDPQLGPLAQNGGPTPTQDLGTQSAARAAVGVRALCKRPDQRGTLRPLPCDIGAFEAP